MSLDTKSTPASSCEDAPLTSDKTTINVNSERNEANSSHTIVEEARNIEDISQLAAPIQEEIAIQPAVSSYEDAPPEFAKTKDVTLAGQEVLNQEANRTLRFKYVDKAYLLASGCLLFWAMLISVNAFVFFYTGKLMISDNALIAITAGITVNVLAVFLGVIHGLFPSSTTKKRKSKRSRK